MTTKYIWDGSHLGSIDDDLLSYEIRDSRVYVKFKQGFEAIANRFDNSIPIIADELKPLFGLPKIGRHRCLIDNRESIISKVECKDEHPFATQMAKTELVPYIQKCYVYRWILGLTQNTDTSLWIRKYKSGIECVTSYRDVSVGYEKKSAQGSCIPKIAVKKWFGSWDQVNKLVQYIFANKKLCTIRFEIETIVRRIDPQQVTWISCMIQRIQERISV